MSHKKIIQAIRIPLGAEYTENAAIGLYTSGGVSELRWSEEPLVGTASLWATGIISLGGIGETTESGDTRRGGCQASFDGLNLAIDNTSQIILTLAALGINLSNLTAELWEFEGTETDSDSVSAGVVFTGVVADQKWDSNTHEIPIKSASYKRNAFAGNRSDPSLNSGNQSQLIPISIGTLCPSFDASGNMTDKTIAEFVRTANKQDEEIYSNAFFTGVHPETKIFPVTAFYNSGAAPYRSFSIETYGVLTLTSPVNPVDTYVIVKSGNGASDTPRLVTSFTPSSDPNLKTITVECDRVFATDLSSVWGSTQSWVQFIKMERRHECDFWPCKSFLSSADKSETTKHELFLDDNGKLSCVDNFGLSITDTNNNSLDIDGEQYSGNFDNVSSFSILPVTGLSDLEEESAANWNTLKEWSTPSGDLTGYNRYPNDSTNSILYVLSGADKIDFVDGNLLDNPTGANDRDIVSHAQASLQVHFLPSPVLLKYIKFFHFSLPSIDKIDPKNIDSIYLGIKAQSRSYYAKDDGICASFQVGFKRFAYTQDADIILGHTSIEKAQIGASTGSTWVDICDLPNRYYEPNDTSDNSKFYRDSVPVGSNFPSINGYNLFKMSCTAYEYNTYVKGGIFFHRYNTNPVVPDYDEFKLYELAIIIKLKDQSISEKVFSPLSARIFNGTWGTRKTATALIENPIDIKEHFARLQNFGGNVEYGKVYDPNALIKTSGVGSYDDTALTAIKTMRPSYQIVEESQMWTDSISRQICATFGICSRIDKDGYECIELLDKTNPTGAENKITFADINGDIGKVTEPNLQDIFVQPVINYGYDISTGKYQFKLQVLNIQEETWSADYTPGFDNTTVGDDDKTDGQRIWGKCKALYSKYKQIEEMPSDLSDLRMVNLYADAYEILNGRIDRMERKRISLDIFYSKGRNYHFAKHLILQLPHQTNNQEIEVFVEKIGKDKQGNKVSIDLVLLDEIT
jgi:hypothetical protein